MPRAKRKRGLTETASAKYLRDPAWKAFLQAFTELGNVTAACKASGVSHDRVRRAYAQVEEFRSLFDEARMLIADRLEDALKEQATVGVEKLKFDREGNALIDPRTKDVYVEREPSVEAATFLLGGLKPEVYKSRFEHTGPGGGPVETKIANLADLVKLASATQPPPDQATKK